jgi:hypothetical protein
LHRRDDETFPQRQLLGVQQLCWTYRLGVELTGDFIAGLFRRVFAKEFAKDRYRHLIAGRWSDADGQETGMFEVPAGGRRYRALELLVKQKRMAKTQLVPCVVRDGGIAEDDSLAENDERVGLHPLDQFRAFQALHDGGMSEEDIAARHFVKPALVMGFSDTFAVIAAVWCLPRSLLR